MKNSQIRILSISTGLFSFLVFAVIFHQNFFQNLGIMSATTVFSLCVTNLFFQPGFKFNDSGDAGPLSSIGVKWYFALFAALVAFSAPIFEANKRPVIAEVLCIFAIGLVFLSLILSNFTREAVSQIDAKVNFSSPHLAWASTLEAIATQSPHIDTRDEFTKLANDFKFASRGILGVGRKIDNEIDDSLASLKKAIFEEDANQISNLSKIRTLLKQREDELRALRRKA